MITMLMKTSLDRLSFAACLIALALNGACGDGREANAHTPVQASVQRVLDKAVLDPERLLPGAIAYYDDPGGQPWSGAAGVGDLVAERPIRTSDRIRAGSVMKTFLAAVTLQHVEEGTLGLSQALPELLPRSVTDRITDADDITLQMLLGHRSGIPEWVTDEVRLVTIEDPSHVWTDEEVLERIGALPPMFPPGTSFGYSNSNYTLVGSVLEGLDEGTWRDQVRKRVLEPLALATTELPAPGSRALEDDHARGYHDLEGTPMDITAMDSSMAGAAGGHALLTTVADLGRFLEALLEGELFERSETLAAMMTFVEAPHESGLPHRYGLGLETFDLPGLARVVGHTGSAGGYSVMMFRVPSHDATLVTALNTTNLFTNAEEVFMPALEVVVTPNGEP